MSISTPEAPPAPRRNPTQTRDRLLGAAFEEIYRSGFQGADLSAIIAKSGVTKGALYHHFDNKSALGHAVIDDVISVIMREKWLSPLTPDANPIDTLIGIVKSTSLIPEHVSGGCPLNNLAQEMSPLDESFRLRLASIFKRWIIGIGEALHHGQAKGQVRDGIKPFETASQLVAMYEGYISLAKNAQDADFLSLGMDQMVRYLETLRP